MKNSLGKRKGFKALLTSLIAALVFLAVGLGTLGSVYGTKDAFELCAKTQSDTETPSVTFLLSNPTEPDGKGGSVTTQVRLMDVYVNLAAIYAEAGTSATLRVERSTGGTTFSTGLNAVFENGFTPTADMVEVGDDGKPVKDIPAPDATDEFFSFVAPFAFPDTGWRVGLYPYVRLSLTGTNPNVLINEVVFVGEKLDSSYEGTGEMCVIPATVYAATPFANEPAAAAIRRAGALIDAQQMPTAMQSTFGRFSAAEITVLKTVAEMRLGNTYAADAAGNALDTYDLERHYGALGIDILTLGTLMFGMSPFGLRFFPMLAAFGALLVLARFVTRLTRRPEAGAVFSVLYALSCLTLGYGHLGTPLMLGIFFFACALDLVHAFYANGMRAGFTGALPLLAAGLLGAAAICVHGAFVIPMAGVCALFVAGMVRQQTAKRYRLARALEEEGAPAEDTPEEEKETGKQRAVKLEAEFRSKNRVAPLAFGVGLLIGTFLLALIGMLPANFTFIKAFDDPAVPSNNVFMLAWKSFAGGFGGTQSGAFGVFYELFRGTGSLYALTAVTVNPVALLAGGAGLIFTAVHLIMGCVRRGHDKAWRAGLRRDVILLALTLLATVAAFAASEGAVFVALMYLSAMLAGACLFGSEPEGKAGTAIRIVNVVGVVLLAAAFAALSVVTFSIPLPASFFTAISG